jgi:dipeptidase
MVVPIIMKDLLVLSKQVGILWVRAGINIVFFYLLILILFWIDRADVPTHMAGLLWFAVDDTSTSPHFPIYGSATRIPKAFAGKGAQDGVTTPILEFNMESAFSVMNLVANWAYSRWDAIYPDVYSKIIEIESNFEAQVKEVEKQAVHLFTEKNDKSASIEQLTAFSEGCGNDLVKNWASFFGTIFMKYRDGYKITPNAAQEGCGCAVSSLAYSSEWYNRIISDTGDRYLDPYSGSNVKSQSRAESLPEHLRPVNKLSLKGVM